MDAPTTHPAEAQLKQEIERLRVAHPASVQECLQVWRVILRNIIAKPEEVRYRTIQLSFLRLKAEVFHPYLVSLGFAMEKQADGKDALVFRGSADVLKKPLAVVEHTISCRCVHQQLTVG